MTTSDTMRRNQAYIHIPIIHLNSVVGPGYYSGKGLIRMGRLRKAIVQFIVKRCFDYYKRLASPFFMATKDPKDTSQATYIFSSVIGHLKGIFRNEMLEYCTKFCKSGPNCKMFLKIVYIISPSLFAKTFPYCHLDSDYKLDWSTDPCFSQT
ncbi:hypothetical protein M422DRAFT_51785 [Sphaerobolus stellatus SS14]|uniref:Unplaced genomic scaffold SPHSTscaffold_120, whole genome shotgun sequence n=1 Tax=Sphaerobolus stellatus (strain SS14) TaxID=990650 RepID=A0A0C9UZV0_SPHS4|nr:hypothetical protein M422DRAFT_51785 [Sphaerobolus stellatus SS14]